MGLRGARSQRQRTFVLVLQVLEASLSSNRILASEGPSVKHWEVGHAKKLSALGEMENAFDAYLLHGETNALGQPDLIERTSSVEVITTSTRRYRPAESRHALRRPRLARTRF